MTRTVATPTEMERRLRTLVDALRSGPLTAQDEAAWNAPYGQVGS
mgnify:CR=1 FL=1